MFASSFHDGMFGGLVVAQLYVWSSEYNTKDKKNKIKTKKQKEKTSQKTRNKEKTNNKNKPKNQKQKKTKIKQWESPDQKPTSQ